MPRDELHRQIVEWRERANEARANAKSMTLKETRATFERIADAYDRMAKSVEADLVAASSEQVEAKVPRRRQPQPQRRVRYT